MSATIKAARGTKLRCRSWRVEGILRMLENTLENGERPEELIVYCGFGKAARDMKSYERIISILKELQDDETLVIQSGKPVSVFRTNKNAPRVVMANNNFVPRWHAWKGDVMVEKVPTPETFHEFESKGLTMWPAYTAGAWGYIGHQGISHGTYQTFAIAAQHKFGGNLRGRLVLTGGLGQMGGAQPLAVTLNDGVCVGVDVNGDTIKRLVEMGWLDTSAQTVDEALRITKEAFKNGKATAIGLKGNAAEVFPEFVKKGITPDIVTDMTPAHDALLYFPASLSMQEANDLRKSNPKRYVALAGDSAKKQVEAMLEFKKRGALVFEYGNDLRLLAYTAGLKDAYKINGFVVELLRPLMCEGRGAFRWIALSGEKEDIYKLDELVLREFSEDAILTKWINAARDKIPFEGLPARVCWLGYGQRARFGKMTNQLVANGTLKGPVAFTRDNFDSGSVSHANMETESMKDGSDPIADWPLLNALLNTAAGADLVAINQGAGIMYYVSTGMIVIADGTKDAEERLERTLTVDPGIGVARHADAGYDEAIKIAKREGIRIPMLE
jgi:urocanate hydratase